MSDTTSPVPAAPVPTSPASVATAPSSPTTAAGPVRTSLRLWPGILILAVQGIAITLAKNLAPGTMIHFYAMFMGPMVGTALFAVWWLFGSRLPWRERWLGLGAFVAIGVVALLCAHSTIGFPVIMVFGFPVVTLAWGVWLLVTPFLQWPARRTGLLVVFLLSWGYFALVRLDGVDGSIRADLVYRWLPTSEEKFLKELADARRGTPVSPAANAIEPVELAPGDWPAFRGPDRDARLPGVRLAMNWSQHPPREIWRHRVGPGWSSFAVVGTRLYTQEQLGDVEAVICYDAATGDQMWAHNDKTRFMEAMAGPGPRATPTFHDGRIYSLGANGTLNCLDAVTGDAVWSRNIATDSGATVPIWGFSSSPLVVDGVLTVFAGGPKQKAVLGYSAATGDLLWSAGEGALSYCSTQFSRLAGVDQLLISTEQGLAAFESASGNVLWTYAWPLEGMSRVVQPTVVGDSDVLIGTGFGLGTQRVHVAREGDAWTTKDVWGAPTRAIRPYYNDLVVHQGHIYGFDNAFFTCVSLEDGKSRWKARGYDNGQVLLLPDQDLLLILSETGEVALVDAKPEMHKERCKFKAISGKTWNHPVIAHERLYVRNGEEAACFELEREGETGIATSE
jgi:outer membrane protein assembly factor BamB